MRNTQVPLSIALIVLVLSLTGCGKPDINAAARLGKVEKLRQAIAAGSDVNQRGKNDNTPLHFATWEGYVDCVRVLLEHHADVNANNKDGPHTPLHIAATFGRTEIARLLIKAGAHTDPRDNNGLTPLHFAAAKGHAELAALLVENGADINARSKNRQDTPLQTARRMGHDNVVQVLQTAAKR